MKQKSLIIFIFIWTIIYALFLKVIFVQIEPAKSSFIYFSVIFSYALISAFLPFFFKNKNQLRLYSFVIPFIFAIIIVSIFIISMALIESYYSLNTIDKIIKVFQLLPYSIGKSFLLALPMGILGYLFGGLSNLITHNFLKQD